MKAGSYRHAALAVRVNPGPGACAKSWAWAPRPSLWHTLVIDTDQRRPR